MSCSLPKVIPLINSRVKTQTLGSLLLGVTGLIKAMLTFKIRVKTNLKSVSYYRVHQRKRKKLSDLQWRLGNLQKITNPTQTEIAGAGMCESTQVLHLLPPSWF